MFQYSSAESFWLPIMLAIIIVVCLCLGLILKNKPEKIKRITLIIIAIILLILEVVKQLYNAFNGSYSTWIIPLHFCSMFVFLIPLAEFFNGKIRDMSQALAFTCSFMFVALFYFQPSGVLGNATSNVFGSFNSFHTFVYHHLIILYFGLTISLNLYKPKMKHTLYVLIGLTIYFIVGVSFAFILNTNYCNFLYSVIDIVESLRLHFGQVLYLIGMYIFGIILSCGFMLIINLIYKKIKEKKIKNVI